jgi:hypothetical protein
MNSMNSAVGSRVLSADVESRSTISEVSLFRLCSRRASYLLIAVGLAVYIGPAVIHHASQLAATEGIRFALLAGLGATAVLLGFELVGNARYLMAFARPLWSAHQINAAAAEDIKACLMVVLFVPLIPWRYGFAHCVPKPGNRWK